MPRSPTKYCCAEVEATNPGHQNDESECAHRAPPRSGRKNTPHFAFSSIRNRNYLTNEATTWSAVARWQPAANSRGAHLPQPEEGRKRCVKRHCPGGQGLRGRRPAAGVGSFAATDGIALFNSRSLAIPCMWRMQLTLLRGEPGFEKMRDAVHEQIERLASVLSVGNADGSPRRCFKSARSSDDNEIHASSFAKRSTERRRGRTR